MLKDVKSIILYSIISTLIIGISIFLIIRFSSLISDNFSNYRQFIDFRDTGVLFDNLDYAIRNIRKELVYNITALILTIILFSASLTPIVLKFISIFRNKPAVDNESVKELS